MPREVTKTKFNPSEKEDRLAAQIIDLANRAKLDTWSTFVEGLQVPADIAPAMMSGRVELLRLATPRPMDAEEVGKLYKLIGGLIETNMALQEHASELANFMVQWRQAFGGLESIGRRIVQFARFEHQAAGDTEIEGGEG